MVDPDECSAHGDCVEGAPDVFVLGDVAEVIGTAPPEILLKARCSHNFGAERSRRHPGCTALVAAETY